MTFEEAYYNIVSHAEECDLDNLYYHMGMYADSVDPTQKLSVALLLLVSGRYHVESDVAAVIKKAACNIIDYGQVEREDPEVRAETMDKMRHLI